MDNLRQIADKLITTQPATIRLRRGLGLAYREANGFRCLTLSRRGTYPSDVEVSVCLAAFDSTAPVIRSLDYQQETDTYIIRLSWPATSQLKLPGIKP